MKIWNVRSHFVPWDAQIFVIASVNGAFVRMIGWEMWMYQLDIECSRHRFSIPGRITKTEQSMRATRRYCRDITWPPATSYQYRFLDISDWPSARPNQDTHPHRNGHTDKICWTRTRPLSIVVWKQRMLTVISIIWTYFSIHSRHSCHKIPSEQWIRWTCRPYVRPSEN